MNVHHMEGVTELVASLACARRALTIARDGEARFRGVPHTVFDYSEILHGLIRQVRHCEARLAAHIEAAGGSVTDGAGDVLTLGINDRRRWQRPAFEIHRPGPRDLERP